MDLFQKKPKQAEVLSHWYAPVPNFSSSTDEFYGRVEKELREQKVPSLEISRVDFAEGGALSSKRQYLRMTRERLVFDICAAPFGTNYFYSCRFAELPDDFSLSSVLTLLFIFGALVYCSVKAIGVLPAIILWLFVAVILTVIFRDAAALGLTDLDAWLMRQPVFGAVYARMFRKETYYRQDTRLMYLTVVEGVVKKLVEEETCAKGVKLLTQYEYAPILRDLYRPTVKELEPKPVPADVPI